MAMTPEVEWDVWDIEALPEEIEQHKLQPTEPRSAEDFRLANLSFEYLEWPPRAHQAYIEVNGGFLPGLTFHNTPVTYELIAGTGKIALASGASIELNEANDSHATKFQIPRAQQHYFSGDFNMLANWSEYPHLKFMTVGDQKLSKEAAKELRQAERLETFDLILDWYTAMLGRAMLVSYIRDRRYVDNRL
jgi:hypothetical protein